MNQEEYRKIASRLGCAADLVDVAAEFNIPEELALIIYTQRMTRDATKRFYVIKNQIGRMGQAYDRGTSLTELAMKYCFPPVLLAYLLFLHKGVPRKQFWQYVRHPDSIRDARIKREITAAVAEDILYSPRGEEIQRERGHLGEKKLFDWLDKRDFSYATEKDLKNMKDKYTKTPDVLFMKPESINGIKVAWIESKANFGDTVEINRNLKKQLIPYVKLFGKGIVVYWFGFVPDVEPPEGITVVDGSFFGDTPAKPPEKRPGKPSERKDEKPAEKATEKVAEKPKSAPAPHPRPPRQASKSCVTTVVVKHHGGEL